jgi:hypothetical protein
MNCQETQRWLYVQPHAARPDIITAHIAQCVACRRAAEALLRDEREIERMALDVHVPEGLAARVLLRHHLSQKLQKPVAHD